MAKNKWLPIVALALIGFLLYLPSLFGKFVWDDEDFVFQNRYVKEFRLDKFFSDSITSGRGKVSNYYRPLQGTVYSLINLMFGLRPFYYHMANVLFHIAAALAIYYFFLALSKKKFAPFLIALFFLVHPVQTEAVSYISGLSDPLYVFFGFLSLIYFLRNSYISSLVFFSLSLLSKETGLVFFPVLFLISLIKNKSKQLIKLLPFFLIVLVYLTFHFKFINQFDIKAAWGNNPYSQSVIIRLATFIQNLFLYVSLIVFPKDLFMERDASIIVPNSIFNSYTAIFIIINIPLLAFIRFHPRRRQLLFTYLAFFVSFLPVSGLVLINGIFYEHFLYLPLVFFAAFLFFLFEKKLNRPVLILITLYFIILAGRNFVRQFDWTDPVRFYQKTLVHAPESIRINNGLAMAYADRGNLDQAIDQYKKTLRLSDQIPNLYHNLANAYIAKGNLKEAEANYRRAIEIDPNFYYSYLSLTDLYRQTNQKDKEAEIIKILIEKFPNLKL